MGRRKLDYFMCEICGMTEKDFQGKFARKNFLEHLNSKVHVNQKFTCDQCDQEFQHKKGLNEHQAAKRPCTNTLTIELSC